MECNIDNFVQFCENNEIDNVIRILDGIDKLPECDHCQKYIIDGLKIAIYTGNNEVVEEILKIKDIEIMELVDDCDCGDCSKFITLTDAIEECARFGFLDTIKLIMSYTNINGDKLSVEDFPGLIYITCCGHIEDNEGSEGYDRLIDYGCDIPESKMKIIEYLFDNYFHEIPTPWIEQCYHQCKIMEKKNIRDFLKRYI